MLETKLILIEHNGVASYNASVKLTLHVEFKMTSLHHLVIIHRFLEKNKQKRNI